MIACRVRKSKWKKNEDHLETEMMTNETLGLLFGENDSILNYLSVMCMILSLSLQS